MSADTCLVLMGDTKHPQDTFKQDILHWLKLTVTFRLETKLQQMEENRKQHQRYLYSEICYCQSTPFTLLLLPLECYQRKRKKLKGILRYHTQYCCCNVKMIKSRFWTLAVFDKLWFAKSNCTLLLIRESVDSLCRDGADTQYMQYLSKSCITLPQIC